MRLPGISDPFFTPLCLQSHREGEIAAGVICSCLPTLPALFRHYYHKHASRSSEPHSHAYVLGPADHAFVHPAHARKGILNTAHSNHSVSKGGALIFSEELDGFASDGHQAGGAVARQTRVQQAPSRVVTTIRGDARSVIGMDGVGLVYPGPGKVEANRGRQQSKDRGIVKTVRIDQCRLSSSEAG